MSAFNDKVSENDKKVINIERPRTDLTPPMKIVLIKDKIN